MSEQEPDYNRSALLGCGLFALIGVSMYLGSLFAITRPTTVETTSPRQPTKTVQIVLPPKDAKPTATAINYDRTLKASGYSDGQLYQWQLEPDGSEQAMGWMAGVTRLNAPITSLNYSLEKFYLRDIDSSYDGDERCQILLAADRYGKVVGKNALKWSDPTWDAWPILEPIGQARELEFVKPWVFRAIKKDGTTEYYQLKMWYQVGNIAVGGWHLVATQLTPPEVKQIQPL